MRTADTRTAADGHVVLDVKGLTTVFDGDAGSVSVVDSVDLQCRRGRCLGVVGESGSGKSMTFLSVMGVLPARARVAAGEALFEGRDVFSLSERELRTYRGRRIAMIFQDALAGLNPAFTVGRQLADIFRAHEGASRQEAWKRAVDALDQVRIPKPDQRAKYFPHQLSGGMRQRVMIAMGIAMRPDVLIADEPTTALDVTIQAQILDLLESLRRDLGLALVLITHDLGVVGRYADEIAVMYAGRVIERGPFEQVFADPRHPYTAALQRSIPRPDRDSEDLTPIPGAPPRPGALPPGCAFEPRCPLAGGRERCRTEQPALRTVDGQLTACHFAEELASVAGGTYA